MNSKLLGLLVAVVSSVLGFVLRPYILKEVQWRKKFRKYNERQVEIFECAQKSEARLYSMRRGDEYTKRQIDRIELDERKFNRIVRHEPLD